jgi:pimeloyl-ACP methyl ester carboxylesterase
MKKKAKKQSWFRRHRIVSTILILLAAIILFMVGLSTFRTWQTNKQQAALEPFYDTTGLSTEGPLGEVVRSENLGQEVVGGIGYRILYRTQSATGQKTFSSGMVFVPYAPAQNRPVLAWAHGTLGLGDACTPSRDKNPGDMSWLGDALAQGWVVTATDYAGQGTPGTQGYLVGGSEAQDVVNSVRAARNMEETNASNTYAIWGHSQGGQSALFTASLSEQIAPELDLKGTVAAAPAAELVPLLNAQYGTPADWVIGPIVATSWPAFDDQLNVDDILTTAGKKSYETVANQCIKKSVLGGLVRDILRQKFFKENPIDNPAWKSMAEQQSAPDLAADQALLVVESKQDKVVLPSTTALYIQQACAAGSNLQSLWIDKGAHQDIPALTTGQTITWLADRFSGQVNKSSCSQPPAVTPASL